MACIRTIPLFRHRVLLTQEPPVLDPATGKELGRLEIVGPKKRSDRGNIVGRDGVVFSSWGYDGPALTITFPIVKSGKPLSIRAIQIVRKVRSWPKPSNPCRHVSNPQILVKTGCQTAFHSCATKHGGNMDDANAVSCASVFLPANRFRCRDYSRVTRLHLRTRKLETGIFQSSSGMGELAQAPQSGPRF